MADSTRGRRNRSLYFVAGALVAVVGVFAFMLFDDQSGRGGTGTGEIAIGVPKT